MSAAATACRVKLDEAGKASLGFIVSGATRMSQLIDALLEYAMAGAIAVCPVSEVQMNEVLNDALANLHRAIQDSGASVTYDSLPAVLGDELQLVQLFQNLIGNALKYHSRQVPAIHISAALQEEDFLFSVSENGQGIAAEYHEQIFQIFKRLHGHEYPGTGIELATCKKIVERHGGLIWVQSEANNGSTFFFTVPAPKGSLENGRHG